jgi:hypothetical protein
VRPYAGFEEIQAQFDEELRLLDDIDNHVDAWESAYEQIRETVTLKYPDGGDVPEFVLHIDGDKAWWRWSDEAFGQESQP